MISHIVFYLFAIVLVLSAGMVVLVRNPVHAALFLILAFFSSATIWLLLYAEFLAITLVLVYVGAVMVLFLFVVMMLDVNLLSTKESFARYLPIGIIVSLLMIAAMGLIVSSEYFNDQAYVATKLSSDYNNTRELGKVLYTDYILQFEIAGLILMVAIVAAISLTMRRRSHTPKPLDNKLQDIDHQLQANKHNRLEIVKMKSEKKPEVGDN